MSKEAREHVAWLFMFAWLGLASLIYYHTDQIEFLNSEVTMTARQWQEENRARGTRVFFWTIPWTVAGMIVCLAIMGMWDDWFGKVWRAMKGEN